MGSFLLFHSNFQSQTTFSLNLRVKPSLKMLGSLEFPCRVVAPTFKSDWRLQEHCFKKVTKIIKILGIKCLQENLTSWEVTAQIFDINQWSKTLLRNLITTKILPFIRLLFFIGISLYRYDQKIRLFNLVIESFYWLFTFSKTKVFLFFVRKVSGFLFIWIF